MASNRKISSIKNNSESTPASRRDLLKGLSLAGLAATSSVALTNIPTEEARAPSDPHHTAYQETEHIRTFYALARW
jgi:hypothetical protein